MSIHKGRLGGKAWFYAQGQRAWHEFNSPMGALALHTENLPQWAIDAWKQGFHDNKNAEHTRRSNASVEKFHGKRTQR